MIFLIVILASLLIIVSIMYLVQKKEEARRIVELKIAYKKVYFRIQEKKNKEIELSIANQKLVIKNEEKDLLADQLILANAALVKREIDQNEYIEELEKMMYMISHEMRQPITHLQGLSNLFDQALNSSKDNLNRIVGFMKLSVNSLDVFTRNLTKHVSTMMQRRKDKE